MPPMSLKLGKRPVGQCPHVHDTAGKCTAYARKIERKLVVYAKQRDRLGCVVNMNENYLCDTI